jgi:hypothetical protein
MSLTSGPYRSLKYLFLGFFSFTENLLYEWFEFEEVLALGIDSVLLALKSFGSNSGV